MGLGTTTIEAADADSPSLIEAGVDDIKIVKS